MKIKKIHIKQFKRFTDLTIQNIPNTARLIILVGPNGCGKTSIFEAFNQWYRYKGWGWGTADVTYFEKINFTNESHYFDLGQNVNIDFYDLKNESNREQIQGKFYFRSAYRNDPNFSISSISKKSCT